MSEMAKSLQEARSSLMKDIKTLNDLLSSLGETMHEQVWAPCWAWGQHCPSELDAPHWR